MQRFADFPLENRSLKSVRGRLVGDCKLLTAEGAALAGGPSAATGAIVIVLNTSRGAWWEVEVEETGDRGFVAAQLVSVLGGGDASEDDQARQARRAALLRQSCRVLDGLPDTDVGLLAMCLGTAVVGQDEVLLRKGEYPSSLLVRPTPLKNGGDHSFGARFRPLRNRPPVLWCRWLDSWRGGENSKKTEKTSKHGRDTAI